MGLLPKLVTLLSRVQSLVPSKQPRRVGRQAASSETWVSTTVQKINVLASTARFEAKKPTLVSFVSLKGNVRNKLKMSIGFAMMKELGKDNTSQRTVLVPRGVPRCLVLPEEPDHLDEGRSYGSVVTKR